MDETFEQFFMFWEDFKLFLLELTKFIFKSLHISFLKFEQKKGVVVAALYRQRGKKSRQLTHYGMAALTGIGVLMAPIVAQEFPGQRIDPWQVSAAPAVLSASTDESGIDTQISSKVRDSIIEYEVKEGDNIRSIAAKFGVSEETVRWQNDITGDRIKIGQMLQILPVTGVAHKVSKGDTVHSIAKKYDSEAQAIADFPFNAFSNDETLELAVGQVIIVPEGVRSSAATGTPRPKQLTPDAGTVVASGLFVWPTQGRITQRFSWYHPGIDVANSSLPNVVAADAGSVVYSGWDGTGYGNMVIIDHGNGYRTRYGHMSQLFVVGGQSVGRGASIGKMGSTGRSTGPHTHFEIYLNGARVNPLSLLR